MPKKVDLKNDYPDSFYIGLINQLEKKYKIECVSVYDSKLEFISMKQQDSFIIPLWFAEQLIG